jgi:hypothetical protein
MIESEGSSALEPSLFVPSASPFENSTLPFNNSSEMSTTAYARTLVNYALAGLTSGASKKHGHISDGTAKPAYDPSKIYLPSGHWFIHPDTTSVYIYYSIAPFLTCIIIVHLSSALSRAWSKRQRRRNCSGGQGQTTKGTKRDGEEYAQLGSNSDTRSTTVSKWSRWYLAPRTALRNTLALRSIPASMFSVSNYAELCWTIGYCAVILVPTFVVSSFFREWATLIDREKTF